MELHKIPHPDNFDYVRRVSGRAGRRSASTTERRLQCQVKALGEDVFRLSLFGPWKKREMLHRLHSGFRGAGRYELQLDSRGGLQLAARDSNGGTKQPSPSLIGRPGGALGISGSAWLLRLVPEVGDRFFGMGEKWGPLEKGNRQSQFWNTDVWADYSGERIQAADVDAAYASIPYLIVERAGTYFGLLLDNPYQAFMATAPGMSLFGSGPFESEDKAQDDPDARQLYLGALGGQPSVYFLVAPTLRELTSKLQRLVGVTPRPPLWALGHQQSRWGYANGEHLCELDEQFEQHRMPTDGLWLDIDYMDDYRVFTCRAGALEPDVLSRLRAKGRRIVPILDPGVKVEQGYRICDEGLAKGHFCLSPSGRPYVGIVWPGRTYFPDFSRKKTRAFWAREVARFAALGFDGFWVDMNDPSTGPIESRSMLFNRGKTPHEAFHNQYGLAMARATREGLLEARPTTRPFVLTRSASTGIAESAAMWTGDNVSSFTHLARAIPTSLNLALSGVPFNGPDVPGFGGDATAELSMRFYQAMFLFPFLRNHAVQGSRRQEPWAFGAEALRVIRHYVLQRYRFLPYLYQLFIEQERAGAPILAPLFIDEPSREETRAEDQFFVGPWLLQAPVVTSGHQRRIYLPAGLWYCMRTGQWMRGGRFVEVYVELDETPLYVKAGAVLPLARYDRILPEGRGAPDASALLRDIELHVFLPPPSLEDEQLSATAEKKNQLSSELPSSGQLDYTFDDGESLAYREGHEWRCELSARADGEVLHLEGRLRQPKLTHKLLTAGGRPEGMATDALRFLPVVHGWQPRAIEYRAESYPLRERRQKFFGHTQLVLSLDRDEPLLLAGGVPKS